MCIRWKLMQLLNYWTLPIGYGVCFKHIFAQSLHIFSGFCLYTSTNFLSEAACNSGWKLISHYVHIRNKGPKNYSKIHSSWQNQPLSKILVFPIKGTISPFKHTISNSNSVLSKSEKSKKIPVRRLSTKDLPRRGAVSRVLLEQNAN